jgi:signal transduction histidine kinase
MLSLLRTLSVVAALAFLGVLAWSETHGVDGYEQAGYLMELRRLRVSDVTLAESLLEARLGLVAHYDPVNAAESEIAAALHLLESPPAYLARADTLAVLSAQQTAQRVFDEKARLVERFKTEHAALRNSARYFPNAVGLLLSLVPPAEVHAQAEALLGDMAKFLQASEAQLREQVQARIAALDQARRQVSEVETLRAVEHVLLHARLLLERKPRLDALTDAVLALPSGQRIDALAMRFAVAQQRAEQAAERAHVLLFVLAFISLASGAGYLVTRLKRAAGELASTMQLLEQANVLLARERQKEKQLHELKSRFAARTSHEFRTPLSIIMSSAELLAHYGERFSEQKRLEHRGRIEGAVREMTQMLDEILGAFRDDASEAPLKLEQVRLTELCAAVVDDLSAGARVTVRCPPGLEAELDPRLIRRVLGNLLSNALKYSPADAPVTLSVETRGEQLWLEVRDRGVGIPEDDQLHLFEDFHRGSNVGDVPGTGLGLALARRAIELHGGDIKLSSHLNRGSTFVVKLPQRQRSNPPEAH